MDVAVDFFTRKLLLLLGLVPFMCAVTSTTAGLLGLLTPLYGQHGGWGGRGRGLLHHALLLFLVLVPFVRAAVLRVQLQQ